MALGAGERLFEGGDDFKYFLQRGSIFLGKRLFEGRLLFEEMRYLIFLSREGRVGGAYFLCQLSASE